MTWMNVQLDEWKHDIIYYVMYGYMHIFSIFIQEFI